jgi:hypothetical protein
MVRTLVYTVEYEYEYEYEGEIGRCPRQLARA